MPAERSLRSVEIVSKNLPVVAELSTLGGMSEAHAFSASEPSELLSWGEICRRYPDQWVALVEIEWVDEDEVRAARVAGHGPHRADPLEQARHLHARYEEIGHFFTGRVRAPRLGFFAS